MPTDLPAMMLVQRSLKSIKIQLMWERVLKLSKLGAGQPRGIPALTLRQQSSFQAGQRDPPLLTFPKSLMKRLREIKLMNQALRPCSELGDKMLR
jgi:hypothetical protein